MAGGRAPSRSVRATRRAGFTLVDVLVSIGVMGVLIGLMLPALSGVRETARRVNCGSNMRQIGLGVQLFADANRDRLPPTVRSQADRYRLRGDKSDALGDIVETMTLRFEDEALGLRGLDGWDGLGLLYAGQHVNAPGVFYCPSHQGEFRASDWLDSWDAEKERVVGNYNLRLEYETGHNQRVRYSGLSSRIALVTDGFTDHSTLNHVDGTNVLRVDGSVKWFVDSSGTLAEQLNSAAFLAPDPSAPSGGDDDEGVWDDIDRTASRARARR